MACASGWRLRSTLGRRGGRLLPPPQQEGHGRSAGCVPFEGFSDGPAQGRSPVQIQQFEQLGSLTARRFSMGEGEIQQGFAFRHGLGKPAGGRGMKGLAFFLQQRLLMSRIQQRLVPIITAAMARDLLGSVQDTNPGVGGE